MESRGGLFNFLFPEAVQKNFSSQYVGESEAESPHPRKRRKCATEEGHCRMQEGDVSVDTGAQPLTKCMRGDNMVQKYFMWCDAYGYTPLPVEDMVCKRFLAQFEMDNPQKASVRRALHALDAVAGFPPPLRGRLLLQSADYRDFDWKGVPEEFLPSDADIRWILAFMIEGYRKKEQGSTGTIYGNSNVCLFFVPCNLCPALRSEEVVLCKLPVCGRSCSSNRSNPLPFHMSFTDSLESQSERTVVIDAMYCIAQWIAKVCDASC